MAQLQFLDATQMVLPGVPEGKPQGPGTVAPARWQSELNGAPDQQHVPSGNDIVVRSTTSARTTTVPMVHGFRYTLFYCSQSDFLPLDLWHVC